MIHRSKTFSAIAHFCGVNPIRFYILWGLFSVLMSGLLGLFYFDMYDFPKLILLTSPFMFFIGAVTLVLGDNLEKAKGFWDLAFQGTVFALHFGMVIFIWVYVGNENYNDLKGVLFYISPVLLFFGWFLNANITLRYFQLTLGKEWWLDISLEGDYVPSTGSIRDIHVGQKSIDRTLFIWGEPRTWWEYRLRDPESIAVLRLLQERRLILSLTSQKMDCDPQIESAVKEWHEHLKGHPPSLQDWKDSGYRFTTSADETAQASAHPGSPIAIPSLVDEKEP